MFRIESYITPIILEHVAKYVKNIRPEDMQLSLWEGEVTLQNLDLRLDVLEEELNLPVELLTGHIHELTIRVPWTKITSEPIRIIINTIEFVLKLHGKSGDGSSSTSASPQRKSIDVKKRKRPKKVDAPDANQQTPGSGIINKIISNICLECHNIILKYVEDDIVVSMNIQLLQFNSADEQWKMAMIDVHPVKVLIRKVIKVSDLTICVDKQNSAGQIEVCQEPILYRCSFELRVLHRHNTKTVDTRSTTRIALYTKSMDMNISSMQFPMIMRLIKMITNLKHSSGSNGEEQNDENADEQESEDEENESFLLWAWNRLPTLALDLSDTEETCANNDLGHFKDFGVYIEALNFTFKNSELVVDTIMSNAKRIKYTPIIRITLGGLYCEKVLMEEQNWHSLKAGISQLLLDPLGPYKSDDFSDMSLIQSPSEEILNGYIDKSLFDGRTCTTDKCLTCANFDEYMTRYTDEYMLSRTPVFAFDSIEYKTPSILCPSLAEKRGSFDIPLKDTHVTYRFLSSGVTFRWNQTAQQVKNIINDLMNSYDYTAYCADRLDSAAASSTKLPPPLMEDFDELMLQIPICIYKFDLNNISIEVHAQTEPLLTQKNQRRLSNTLKQTMPYFVVNFQHLDGTLCMPMNQDKLVHTTCQLPDKPHVLVDVCYKNYLMNLKDFSISMTNKVKKSTARLLHIPHLHLRYGDLIEKHHWVEDSLIPMYKTQLRCEACELDFTKRDLLMSLRLLNCLSSYKQHILWKIANESMNSASNCATTTLHTTFKGMLFKLRHYPTYTIGEGSLQSVRSEIACCKHLCHEMHVVFNTAVIPEKENWLQIQAQRNPQGIETMQQQNEALFAVLLTVERFNFFIDVSLLEFLRYQEESDGAMERDPSSEVELQTQPLQLTQVHSNTNIPTRVYANPLTGSIATGSVPPLLRRSSRNSMPSRKISHPEETIHFSSERDEKVDLDKTNATAEPSEEKPNVWWEYIKSLAISVEIAQGRILIAEEIKYNKKGDLRSVCTEIMLPRISLKSANAENLSHANLREKFSISSAPKETVSWIIALYCLAVRKIDADHFENILSEVYTTITIAIAHKMDSPIESSLINRVKGGQSEYSNVTRNEEQIDAPSQSSSQALNSINVHVDITPIQVYMTEEKCKTLLQHLGIISKVIKLFRPISQISVTSQSLLMPIEIITAAEENATIKQFLDLETSSMSSALSENKKVSPNIISLFCQCTIAKIFVELESAPMESNSKVVFELEDLLTTIDKREDFTKYTGKVGQCSLNYYVRNSQLGWIAQPYIRIKVFGEVANLPFINIVYTCVGLKSFYSRLGIKRKADSDRCISEILITMQAVEIIIDVERLNAFLGSLGLFFQEGESKKFLEELKQKEVVVRNPVTASDLPLIHLDSNGFTIYTPVCTDRESCTVLIWKLESIKVSPNLENPLQRNPIRGDVYGKAAQMGFLNTPGSLIEDRQYELEMKNISIASGRWEQILIHMNEIEKTLYHTNPAVEWNSQNRRPSLHISNIFSNFNFVGIFAPCIVYNNVLICGQAVEFNCASDLIATVNTDQIYTLSVIAKRISNIFNVMGNVSKIHSEPSNSGGSLSIYHSFNSLKTNSNNSRLDQRRSVLFKEGRSSSMFDSIDEGTEQVIKTDSGIQSTHLRFHCARCAQRNECVCRHIPQTISLLAGTFSIQFFAITTGESCEDGVCRRKRPLVLLTISQPSFMFTQNIFDSTMQVSLFNFNIHIPDIVGAAQDSAQLFPIEILATHAGDLSPTGIPPPLVTFRKHLTKQDLLEIDIETSKPIVFTLHEIYTKLLLQNALIIYDTIIKSEYLESRSTKVTQRLSKIKLIRGHFLNSDRFHLKLDEIIVLLKNESDYNCKFACTDVQLNSTFLTRPEKAVLKSAVGSVYLKVGEKIFMHPIAFRSSIVFTSETWHRLPLISSTIKFDVIQADVDVCGLQELQRSIDGVQRITLHAAAEWRRFLSGRPSMGEPVKIDPSFLVLCQYPSAEDFAKAKVGKEKKSKIQREEFYQDDLRAGAFQFVEMVTDAFLPLPYQIQIIKKNFGIICWRYPQPRKMCKIQIYPVPMAVQEPINIKCRMEYFSETHECFLLFCEFMLSETECQELTLPEREICANIWRVVIIQSLISVNGDCFDPKEIEEDKIPSVTIDEIFAPQNKDSDFILHPRVLVGCLRIDTSFQSKSVPKVQILVSCSSLQVKLLNQTNENRQLPSVLSKYRLAQSTQIHQAFLVVHLERLSVHGAFNSSSVYCIDGTLCLGIRCLDYGFLNMLPLLEEATLQSFVYVNKPKHILSANISIDKFRINLGPSIVHTLISSKSHWEADLFKADVDTKSYVILTKCTVINLMRSQIAFGQSGSTERIHLLPMECSLYCFGNDCYNQELTFFIADDETHIIDASQSIFIPLKLDEERKLKSIRIGDKCLTIEFRKLASTQIMVLLKGQIELISNIPQELRVEFHSENQKQNKLKPFQYPVEGNSCGSFYWAVHSMSNITMILKFGSTKGKGRSGDIPLKPNKKLPWLVKVPIADNDFVSLWVRVLREDISELCTENFKPQKVLVTIWPVFEVRSMLPCPLEMKEKMTGQKFSLAPKGGRQILSVPATHLTEHKLEFDAKNDISACSCQYHTMLTLKTMQWNNFFWYDETIWDVDNALYKLTDDDATKWPLDNEEELRIERNSINAIRPELVYKYSQSREFSCTLCLEVSPWGMFINASGVDINIYDNKLKERVPIKSNCVEMIATIASSFTIDLPQESDWVSSWPIYYGDQTLPSGSRYFVLSEGTGIDIVIVRKNDVFKFMLELKVEQGRHIIRLCPKYTIVNLTKSKLQVLPFAMDHKESAKRCALNELDSQVDKMDLDRVASVTNCIGRTLDSFFDFKPSTRSKRSKDTAFVCFVCLKVSETSDISIPIPLSLPFNRRCFSIRNGETSIPLAVTLIEKDRVYYLNVFEDYNPAFLISNQTDVQFIIAQTSASENSKVSRTMPEYNGRHFEWHQHLPAFSNTYYTPPEIYSNFPDVEFSMCNITLALYNECVTKKKIKWSKPIRTDKTWEKFLYIPNHGDVKVIICDQHRVIRIFIYYIAQLEFSVKDLRSRLSVLDAINRQDVSLMSLTPSTAIMDSTTLNNTPAKCMHFTKQLEEKTQFKVRLYVKETVLSFHTDAKDPDCIKSEIIGLYVDDFMIAYDDINDKRELNVVIPNLQLDNQIYSTGKYDFPVVLCAQEIYERFVSVPSVHYLDHTYQSLTNGQNMVFCTLAFFEDELKMKSLALKLSPIRIYIEDAYLNDLLDAVVECAPRNCVYTAERSSQRITLSQGEFLLPQLVTAQAICIAEPLQLRNFEIESLSMLLSVHTSMRLYIALDHSPLSFSTYNRQQILTVPLRFGQSLSMHYLSGAIFGAGWVVGSLEILGSPSGLARSFTTGLRDFVSMPMQGLFRGPWGFIVGVTQGSASLLRNVTAGTVNSVSKLAASVARNLDRLTLDQEHIERTEALRRCRPHGFTEGFAQGITGLGISILGAVGGLARHTLEARTAVEVVTGMGKGIVGALAKPISGAAELVALAGQGMLNTVGFNMMPELRMPCVCPFMSAEPSAYRIWKQLPGAIKSDQILFNHQITLVMYNQLRRGYALLTSTVFAVMEEKGNNLLFVVPIDKIEMASDSADKTLYYVHLVKEREGADEDNYTNQRIITYLHSSTSLRNMSATAAGSLSDLLQSHEQELQANRRKKLDWAFHINETLGEYIIKYIKIMNRKY